MVELDDHPRVEELARGHKSSRKYHCTSLIESLSSGSAAKAGKSEYVSQCTSLVLQSELLVMGPRWKKGRRIIEVGDRSGGRSSDGP